MYSYAMGHWTDTSLFHNVAHRGASAYAPDNSLEALRLARKHFATDVEVDVHCTSDGEFIVRHDATIGDSPARFISEITYDKYRYLCDQQSEPSVTLHQVIDVAKRNRLGIYLDIKQVLPSKLPALCRAIRSSDYQDRIVVASFRTDIVKDVKKNAPELLTSVLFHDPNLDLNSLVKGLTCDFLHPCFDVFKDPLRYFTEEWIERARSTGAELIVWNITSPEMADAIVRMNVRGACADDPQILEDALAKYRGQL